MYGQFSLPCFIEILVFNVNTIEPDQTPLSAASGLVLHYLPMSILLALRHKWVNMGIINPHFYRCNNLSCPQRYLVPGNKIPHGILPPSG